MPCKTQKSPSVLSDQINTDLTQLHDKILAEKDSNTVEQLWDEFKICLSKTLSENIPEKTLKQKNLPWITNDLRRKNKQTEEKNAEM